MNTGLKRETIDKYYTSPDIVKTCIDLVKENIRILPDDVCIEPSAGNGAFIGGIKTLFRNWRFYDLEPENDEIVTQDYLLLQTAPLLDKRVHVVGNPPFGRQSSLAIKFIKKSAEYCDTIAFVLPKSFKKESLRKHFALNFHLKCEYDLPDNSFTVDNQTHDVPCVFQIWVKQDEPRKIQPKLVPTAYKFVKKREPHDISFRRVGGKAGEVDTQTNGKSIQSHYFIKFDNMTDDLLSRLRELSYACKDNTCGPKSISKQELMCEFNKVCLN